MVLEVTARDVIVEDNLGDRFTLLTQQIKKSDNLPAHKPSGERPPNHPSTPWGRADMCYEWAPGIVMYITPRHGGIWLSPERLKVFRSRCPAVKDTFAGFPWFEEDQDASLIYAAWPELYRTDRCQESVESIS